MVLTVRDEERFLAANLAYHHALGVTRAYVFLDRCGDASKQQAQSYRWVQVIEQDRLPDEQWIHQYQARCVQMALELARGEGYEWLMFVDPDEFAFGQRPAKRYAWLREPRLRGRKARPEEVGSLTEMLKRVGPETEQVLLLPKEVVPTPLAKGEPFWRLHYFQVRGALQRSLLDPISGQVRPLTKWLGHTTGKGIVRTAAEVQAGNPHRWAPSQDRRQAEVREIPSEWCGSLYHFVVVSADHWWEKYRKLGKSPPLGPRGTPMPFPKQAWTEATMIMSEAEARAYYDRWVVVKPRQLIWARLLENVVHESVVETVLAGCAASGAWRDRLPSTS
jgi:hypothetical protein